MGKNTDPIFSDDVAALIVRWATPVLCGLQEQIRTSRGRLPLAKEQSALVDRLKISNYPLMYLDESLVWKNFLIGVFGAEDARKKLDSELSEASLGRKNGLLGRITF